MAGIANTIMHWKRDYDYALERRVTSLHWNEKEKAMREYWIVNDKRATYVPTDSEHEDWAGDWKTRYPHVAGLAYIDISNPHFDDVTANGIRYTYDLCYDGARFRLWVDRAEHDEEDIARAKAELRRDRDVVSLAVTRLYKASAVIFSQRR